MHSRQKPLYVHGVMSDQEFIEAAIAAISRGEEEVFIHAHSHRRGLKRLMRKAVETFMAKKAWELMAAN